MEETPDLSLAEATLDPEHEDVPQPVLVPAVIFEQQSKARGFSPRMGPGTPEPTRGAIGRTQLQKRSKRRAKARGKVRLEMLDERAQPAAGRGLGRP
jgi:hypothetical protein